MKSILILFLLFISSCATKYVVPGNRFMTPETQGDAFRGQVELMNASATLTKIDVSKGNVDNGVEYTAQSRFGFLFANSFFDNFDFVWSHTGGSNSLLGGKLQLVGGSKAAGGDGHKLGVAALFGDNDYETDDKSIDFELTGKEFLVLYGYRLSEFILPYTSFSYAKYSFDGTMKPSGLKPSFNTKAYGLNAGIELNVQNFFGKLEATYQQLSTTGTKDEQNFMFGYSVGFAW
jgi:hypothetical protein